MTLTPAAGVFVYGSMAAAGEISAVLGRPAVRGADYLPAVLHGWRRTWSVCTDNTTSRAVRYHEPGTGRRPRIQVLFLNIEPDPDADVTGYVLFAGPGHLVTLDEREGNYDRVVVTDAITTAGGSRPGVVWAYAGKHDRAARARAAITEGTARVRQEYLDKVVAAFEGHDAVLAEVREALARTRAPVVSLERRTG